MDPSVSYTKWWGCFLVAPHGRTWPVITSSLLLSAPTPRCQKCPFCVNPQRLLPPITLFYCNCCSLSACAGVQTPQTQGLFYLLSYPCTLRMLLKVSFYIFWMSECSHASFPYYFLITKVIHFKIGNGKNGKWEEKINCIFCSFYLYYFSRW